MGTKKAAKHKDRLGARTPAKAEAAFETHSHQIHESLDDAINKIEKIKSGKMSPESAMVILEKIKIVQSLLFTAERELNSWLQSQKF